MVLFLADDCGYRTQGGMHCRIHLLRLMVCFGGCYCIAGEVDKRWIESNRDVLLPLKAGFLKVFSLLDFRVNSFANQL